MSETNTTAQLLKELKAGADGLALGERVVLDQPDCNIIIAEVTRLQAEVERLTKREDALEAKISEALRAFHDGFSRVPVSLINMINDAQRVLLRPTDEARSARDAKIAKLEARMKEAIVYCAQVPTWTPIEDVLRRVIEILRPEDSDG